MLQIPDDNWKYSEWIKYIIENKKEVFASQKDTILKVYYVHSDEKARDRLISYPGHNSKQQGDFTVITMDYYESATRKEKKTEYWMHEKEPGLLMFFTSSTIEGYEKTLRNKIEHMAGLHEMWIKSTTFRNIVKYLIDEKGYGIIKFLADRRRYDNIPQQVKENARRHILYRSDNPWDGIKRLDEMEYQYGLTPHSVEFVHEGTRMQLTDDGLFNLRTITEESFELMDDILEQIKDEEKLMRTTAQSIKFTPQIELHREILEAGKIVLDKELDAEMARQIVKQFRRFTFLDSTIIAGSLVFYSDVIDRQKGSIFSISATKSSILLVPKYQTTFESFLKFYKSIIELIDENAKWGKFSELVGSSD